MTVIYDFVSFKQEIDERKNCLDLQEEDDYIDSNEEESNEEETTTTFIKLMDSCLIFYERGHLKEAMVALNYAKEELKEEIENNG